MTVSPEDWKKYLKYHTIVELEHIQEFEKNGIHCEAIGWHDDVDSGKMTKEDGEKLKAARDIKSMIKKHGPDWRCGSWKADFKGYETITIDVFNIIAMQREVEKGINVMFIIGKFKAFQWKQEYADHPFTIYYHPEEYDSLEQKEERFSFFRKIFKNVNIEEAWWKTDKPHSNNELMFIDDMYEILKQNDPSFGIKNPIDMIKNTPFVSIPQLKDIFHNK
jgi:hypothetical protein